MSLPFGQITLVMGFTVFMEGVIRTEHPILTGSLLMVVGGALILL